MTKLSESVALFFCKKGVIKDKYLNIYSMGYKNIICDLICYLFLILVAVSLNMLIEGIIFYSVFAVLRHFCGGYHAKTEGRCNLLFGSVYVSFMITTGVLCKNMYFVDNMILYQTVICLVSCCILAKYAPVQNSNSNLSADKIKKQKVKIAIIIFISVLLMMALLLILKSTIIVARINYSITLSIFIASISSLAGAKLNKSNNKSGLLKCNKKISLKKMFKGYKKGKQMAVLNFYSFICSFASIMAIYSITTYCRGKFYKPNVPENLNDFLDEFGSI